MLLNDSISSPNLRALPAKPALEQAPEKRSGWARRIRLTLAAVCLLGVAGFLLRAPLLTSLAKAWVIDNTPLKADAVVVLGGNPVLRPAEAAKLYHDGVVPRILYMDVKAGAAVELGIIPSEKESTLRILLSNNVPESATTAVGHNVASTFDESRAVLAWVRESGAKSILIDTDLFHTRRARWIFQRELAGTGVQVFVHAAQPKEYGLGNWWQHEEGLIAFQNEVVKSVFYHLKY